MTSSSRCTWQVTVRPASPDAWSMQFEDEADARGFAANLAVPTQTRYAPVVTELVKARDLPSNAVLADGVQVTRVSMGASKVRVTGIASGTSRTVRRPYNPDSLVAIESPRWTP